MWDCVEHLGRHYVGDVGDLLQCEIRRADRGCSLYRGRHQKRQKPTPSNLQPVQPSGHQLLHCCCHLCWSGCYLSMPGPPEQAPGVHGDISERFHQIAQMLFICR